MAGCTCMLCCSPGFPWTHCWQLLLCRLCRPDAKSKPKKSLIDTTENHNTACLGVQPAWINQQSATYFSAASAICAVCAASLAVLLLLHTSRSKAGHSPFTVLSVSPESTTHCVFASAAELKSKPPRDRSRSVGQYKRITFKGMQKDGYICQPSMEFDQCGGQTTFERFCSWLMEDGCAATFSLVVSLQVVAINW